MWGKMGAGRISELCPDSASTENVFDKADAGDSEAVKAIELFCAECAPMIANIQCVADPECFAIGGGVSSRPLFIQKLTEAVCNFQKDMGYIYIGMPRIDIRACAWHDNTVGAWLHFMKQQEKR